MNKINEINRDSINTNNRISELIKISKGIFSNKFANQEFDGFIWNIEHLKIQSGSNTNPRLYFTYYSSQTAPLPDYFVKVVKSWLLLEIGNNPKSMVYRLDSIRVLWNAILMRRNKVENEFDWCNLTWEDINQTELLMREIWANSTTYKRMNSVLGFLRFLEIRKIIFPIFYKIQTPRIEDSNRFTIEGQEKNLAKLPSKAALDGLADIYNKFAKEAQDRLLICAVALFTVTGFRLGELLTLPEDCEVVDLRNGKERYGLRFYKEKPGKAERRFETRWLTPTGAELAKKVIEETREITKDFRIKAKILESDPNTVTIPGYKFGDLLTSKEVTEILGVKDSYSAGQLLNPTVKTKRGSLYSLYQVQNYLHSRRVKRLWTLDRQDGTYQKLSETLFIAPKNFFHAQRSVFPLLIEPLTSGFLKELNQFLRNSISAKTMDKFAG